LQLRETGRWNINEKICGVCSFAASTTLPATTTRRAHVAPYAPQQRHARLLDGVAALRYLRAARTPFPRRTACRAHLPAAALPACCVPRMIKPSFRAATPRIAFSSLQQTLSREDLRPLPTHHPASLHYWPHYCLHPLSLLSFCALTTWPLLLQPTTCPHLVCLLKHAWAFLPGLLPACLPNSTTWRKKQILCCLLSFCMPFAHYSTTALHAAAALCLALTPAAVRCMPAPCLATFTPASARGSRDTCLLCWSPLVVLSVWWRGRKQ